MKQEKDYIRDIAEIRSMMERSSKFLSLSGWSGVLAGVYALAGAGILYFSDRFGRWVLVDTAFVVSVGLVVLVLAIATAVYFSRLKAAKNKERVWNAASREMLSYMAVPLVTGGACMLILLYYYGLVTMLAPVSLIFYGLALFYAGRFTFTEIKILGILQIVLGLLCLCLIPYWLYIWAFGFGVMHIVYGITIHYKYER